METEKVFNNGLLLHIDVVGCPRHAYIEATTLTLLMLKFERTATYHEKSSPFLLTEG
jgi:hypothetical protein